MGSSALMFFNFDVNANRTYACHACRVQTDVPHFLVCPMSYPNPFSIDGVTYQVFCRMCFVCGLIGTANRRTGRLLWQERQAVRFAQVARATRCTAPLSLLEALLASTNIPSVYRCDPSIEMYRADLQPDEIKPSSEP